MNILQFRHFYELYHTGNMTRAAEQLFITQQGLSRSIKSLEKELHTPLFIRTASGMIPTPYADAIVGDVKDILDRRALIERKLACLAQANEGVLSIACNKMLLDSFPHGTQEKMEEILFPNITFNYMDMDDSEAMRQVLADEAAFALIGAPPEEDGEFQVYRLQTYPMAALVAKSHPFANRRQLSLRDLEGQTIISFSRKWNAYQCLVKACQRENVMPEIEFEVSDSFHMYFLCSEGEGIGVCPAFYCRYMPSSDVRIIPLGDETLSWSISILLKKGKEPSSVVRAIIKAFEGIS